MDIIQRTANTTLVLPSETVLSEKNIYFMNGEICDLMAQDFMQAIMYFASKSKTEPVKVFINSEGGEVDAGMMIYDIIQGAPMPIELYCTQKAYSMAAIIFSCGRNGRYILPHGRVMVHEPRIMNLDGGKISSIRKLSEDMCKSKRKLDEILAKHTRQSLEVIEEITSKDNYYTSEEAVEFGIADEVISFKEMTARM